jgi:Bromodomain extra-terminal - transcription regulation
MQQVVDIIQDAIPPEKRGEGDEIEVPLDELDTFTLRKLQSFVEVSIFVCVTVRPPNILRHR